MGTSPGGATVILLLPSKAIMNINYTNVRDFTPNLGHWTPVGTVTGVTPPAGGTTVSRNAAFTLNLEQGGAIRITLLSATVFRVQFDPTPGADGRYERQSSPAVDPGARFPDFAGTFGLSSSRLSIQTGPMAIEIDLQPYRLQVFRNGQLISSDVPAYNLVYIPDQAVIANVKVRAPGSYYFGFGEKAGAQLAKNQFTMTQFNYDNFKYVANTVPPGTTAGPLNPSIALYASIPFVLEINPQPSGDFVGGSYACGIFLDNTSQSYFNMGANDYSNMDGKYYFGALFGPMDYYFFLGDDAPDVLHQYTTLTGRAPMPPRYALGYHQGCYGYFDRKRLEAAADAYRQHRIPCDGLHIDVDFQDNYRTFTHSEMKFPDVQEMMKGLHDKGFKCSTNVTPFITNNVLDEKAQVKAYDQRQAFLGMKVGGLIYDTYAGQGPSQDLFPGGVNYGMNYGTNPYPYPPLAPINGVTPLTSPGNYPDLGREDVRAVWGQQYKHLIDHVGMDMIWQDMMCPALDGTKFTNGTFPLNLMFNDGAGYVPNGVGHNAYALFLLMGTWEGLKTLRPDTRNFIIARGGYAGMQRYAALWTGDSASSWDFLAINLPEVLNLGLSGVPLSGCDIGGFAEGSGSTPGPFYANGSVYGAVTDYELFTRWMHLGSFLPWYRNHYNGYTKQFQEPFAYAEPVPTNCRKYIELRYRMLQIYYDAVYEWTQSGMPVARALFLNDPQDPKVYQHLDDQFFVGRDFLVAPILFQAQQQSPPVASRPVYLPAPSSWFAFMDNAAALAPAVAGGTLITDWFAGLDQVPIYVRAGAILPMRSQVEQYVGELAENPLEIVVYPGPDSASTLQSEYTLYEDDGISTQAETAAAYRTTRITHTCAPSSRRVGFARSADTYAPPERCLFVRFLFAGSIGVDAVLVDGQAVQAIASEADLRAAANPAYYDDGRLNAVVVKIMDTARSSVTVSYSA